MHQSVAHRPPTQAFQRCFRDWIAEALQLAETLELAEVGSARLRLIAIDGKTCRRSHDAANGQGPLHIVSVWASKHEVALGQVATEEKSNEITAIPRLLKQIELTKTVIGTASWGR